jgi:hypothetical protein
MKNKLGYLGLLGILGLLGFINNNPGFYGFFGFFGFFAFFNIIPDEFFKKNVNKSGRNAFITSMIIYPIVAIVGELVDVKMAYTIGFALSFAAQILIFSISLTFYEKSGEVYENE